MRFCSNIYIWTHNNLYDLYDGLSLIGIRAPRCPPGSVETKVGGMETCYVFHMEPKTYRDAMKTCKAVWPLASLVAIESSVEQTIISNMINQSNGKSLLSSEQYKVFYWQQES